MIPKVNYRCFVVASIFYILSKKMISRASIDDRKKRAANFYAPDSIQPLKQVV